MTYTFLLILVFLPFVFSQFDCEHGIYKGMNGAEPICQCDTHWRTAGPTDPEDLYSCTQFECPDDNTCSSVFPGASCPIKGWNCFCPWNIGVNKDNIQCMSSFYYTATLLTKTSIYLLQYDWILFLFLFIAALPFGQVAETCTCDFGLIGAVSPCNGQCIDRSQSSCFRTKFAFSRYVIDLYIWINLMVVCLLVLFYAFWFAMAAFLIIVTILIIILMSCANCGSCGGDCGTNCGCNSYVSPCPSCDGLCCCYSPSRRSDLPSVDSPFRLPRRMFLRFPHIPLNMRGGFIKINKEFTIDNRHNQSFRDAVNNTLVNPPPQVLNYRRADTTNTISIRVKHKNGDPIPTIHETSVEDIKTECWICRIGGESYDVWRPCTHAFCTSCSTNMLQRKFSCPLCRKTPVEVVTVQRDVIVGDNCCA